MRMRLVVWRISHAGLKGKIVVQCWGSLTFE